MKHRSLYKFRDWLFNLLIDYLVNSGWVIVIEDFKRSEKRRRREYIGLTDYKDKIIYLDKFYGTPKTLVHEICHFALGIIFEKMANNLPRRELRMIKRKCNGLSKKFQWEELRTIEFENLFYNSLTKRQIKILQGFIDEARVRGTAET